MMDPFAPNVPLWDLSQSTYPSLPDDDFLALLQKEFPNTTGPIPDFAALAGLTDEPEPSPIDPDGINPQLTALSAPAGGHTPPLTDDSSPSPPASAQDPPSHSRRHSAVFDHDGLKRKASDDDLSDGTSHKYPHGDTPTRTTANLPRGRKSTGNPAQVSQHGQPKDEVRMLRRKEQNRAAQRAFRERKEKHVKDLEDKVSALEDANRASQSENENLRDLLSRLQEENTVLKQTAFTFSVPRNGNPTGPADGGHISAGPSAFGQAGPSSAPAPPAPQQQQQQQQQNTTGDIDWGNLTTFDPSSLNMLDEPGDVNMDFSSPGASGSGANARSPYKTIASNPMYMSFAEPFGGWDQTLAGMNATPGTQPSSQPGSNGPSHQGSFDINSFGSWTGGGSGSFEELFGMQSMDMGALLPSPSQISPVAHAGSNARPQPTTTSSSGTSSSSSSPGPFAFTGGANRSPGAQSLLSLSSELSSPPLSSAAGSPDALHAAGQQHGTGSCPRTKADFAARVASSIASPFAPDAPRPASGSASNKGSPREGAGSAIKKANGDGKDGASQILCQGSVFPKTEKSERNVEVLQAWRSITSNPRFKDVDINELCAEFTNKAKCDGTKVVLDPQGVHQIIDKFTGTAA